MTQANAREGLVDVPGARLRYRLTGKPGAPLLVFENGWGASYEQWAWIERELADHAHLLFYNRAGIGESELLAAQTVKGLSDQFAALPAALGLTQTVVAIGHSFGGLMCSLHASQRRDVLKAVVELDPTPQTSNPVLDGNLRSLGPLVRLVKLCLSLRLPNFMFGGLGKSLPPAQGQEMMRRALSNPASLDAATAEFALLNDIRAAIAKGRPLEFSRLLIGAGAKAQAPGIIGRLLASPKRVDETYAHSKAIQHDRATEDPGCRTIQLPFDHSGVVFDQAGAKASAVEILAFLREIDS